MASIAAARSRPTRERMNRPRPSACATDRLSVASSSSPLSLSMRFDLAETIDHRDLSGIAQLVLEVSVDDLAALSGQQLHQAAYPNPGLFEHGERDVVPPVHARKRGQEHPLFVDSGNGGLLEQDVCDGDDGPTGTTLCPLLHLSACTVRSAPQALAPSSTSS